MGAAVSGTEILQTKLYPPRLHPIVTRERLLKKLDTAASVKLTTIVTGAGYGKSTLAADFLESTEAPYIWYHLEDTDGDLSVFITYLVTGLGIVNGEFGARTFRRLEAADNVAMESRQILATLISEIDARVKEEMFVTLDDFHQVNESTPIIDALDFLLDHIPPNLHFMVLSRSRLNLDLAELAAHRELLEIREEDLCFSPDEVSRLFTEVFKMPLQQEHVWTLSRLTEGWISGLVLFYLAIKDRRDYQIETAISDFETPSAQVAAYLSKAVYGNQDERVKEFLMRSSILSRLNPGFCDELMGIDNSRDILSYLMDERLFTIPLDDRGEWYRFHHLLKSFLLRLFKEGCTEEEIKRLNEKAASLWEGSGELEQALLHYLEAGELEKAADILEAIAHGLMESRRVSFLYNQLSLLPVDVLVKHPWLVFYQAETSDILGDYHKALELYCDATILFKETGNVEVQVLCLLLTARLLNTMGRYDDAREMMAKARDLTPEGSPYWNVLMAFRSITSSLTGISDLAEQCLEDALDRCDEIKDEATRASLLFWCGFAAFLHGNCIQARVIMLEACELAERLELTTVLLQLYLYLSQIDMILGRWTEALVYSEKGTSLGEQLCPGTPFAFACRSNKGGALALLGHHEVALRDAEIASALADKYGPSIETFNTEIMLGWIHKLCGDGSVALEHWKGAERISRESGYKEAELFAKILVIYASLDGSGLDVARRDTVTIIESYEGTSSSWMLVCAHLLLAFIEFNAQRKEDAVKAADAAMERIIRYGGIGWWDGMWRGKANQKEPMDGILALAAEIISEGKQLEFISHIFQAIGSASLPFIRKLEKNEIPQVRKKVKELIDTISREAAEPLRISMLGPFKVLKGEGEIAKDSWKSKKALAVLKYLAAQREGSLIPKDVLMELMWPDSSPASAAKNLNMALSSLRKTLEPQAGRGQSSYLVTSGDSLCLKTGKGGWVDFKLFRNKLSEARDAEVLGDHDLYLDCLRAAEEFCRGDFLEEDLYEDWCRGERDRLKEECLKLLSDICAEHLRRENTEEALFYSEKAIEADPGREGLYRSRMEIYGKIGDRAGIERTYDKCCRYLKDNFDVSPSPETKELYHSLRRS